MKKKYITTNIKKPKYKYGRKIKDGTLYDILKKMKRYGKRKKKNKTII
ncbi:hypothetical protein KBH77_01270 [Patescibacteria group bacterium]|nr:hypothetical protein [Patescibacteria group bacterium]